MYDYACLLVTNTVLIAFFCSFQYNDTFASMNSAAIRGRIFSVNNVKDHIDNLHDSI